MDQGAALTSQQSMIQRLKAPINVEESSEKLYSEEQIKKRDAILEKDSKLKEGLDSFTEEIVASLESQKEFDRIYQESKY